MSLTVKIDKGLFSLSRFRSSYLIPSKDLMKDYKKELKRIKDPEKAFNMVKFENRYRHQLVSDSCALTQLRSIKKAMADGFDMIMVFKEKETPTDKIYTILLDIMNKISWS